jgi:hypothetical protein
MIPDTLKSSLNFIFICNNSQNIQRQCQISGSKHDEITGTKPEPEVKQNGLGIWPRALVCTCTSILMVVLILIFYIHKNRNQQG